MAAGAAPALDKKKDDVENQTADGSQAQPETFKQRLVRVLHDIFAGREEHAGWRQ
jgi:hypothetical protein